jgi:hypothetical protein
VLGLVSYVLRSSGVIAAGLIRHGGAIEEIDWRRANLFIDFVAAAYLEGEARYEHLPRGLSQASLLLPYSRLHFHSCRLLRPLDQVARNPSDAAKSNGAGRDALRLGVHLKMSIPRLSLEA